MKGKHGAPLQRIQIIKGWIDANSGRPKEMVYDVVCSDGLMVDPVTHRCPDNNARVDINTCKISDDVGAVELKTKWQDPEFKSTDNAFYYVRVLKTQHADGQHGMQLRMVLNPEKISIVLSKKEHGLHLSGMFQKMMVLKLFLLADQ